jgi:hypothetical protein
VGLPDVAGGHDSASTPVQKLVGMAYPFMDLMLLTAVVRLAVGRAGALRRCT